MRKNEVFVAGYCRWEAVADELTLCNGSFPQMSSQLRLFDPQIKEKPEQESFIEPPWLVTLRHVDGQIKVMVCAFQHELFPGKD